PRPPCSPLFRSPPETASGRDLRSHVHRGGHAGFHPTRLSVDGRPTITHPLHRRAVISRENRSLLFQHYSGLNETNQPSTTFDLQNGMRNRSPNDGEGGRPVSPGSGAPSPPSVFERIYYPGRS